MQTTRHNSKRARRGMTLIELLVVVFIILAVSAAIVPVIAPTAAGRRQREAARAVSTFLSSARANAIEAGRPAGVWLEGIDGERGTVLTLSHCEVPPAFAGLTQGATVDVQINGGVSQIVNMTPACPVGMIRRGDIISLKHGAAVFQITGGMLDSSFPQDRILSEPVLGTTTTYWNLNSVLTTAPATIPAGTYSFQIFRQPRKSAASAVELPPGTAIDLYYSGDDNASLLPRSQNGLDFRFYRGNDDALSDNSSVPNGHTEPVIILFGANGIPDSVFRLKVDDTTMDMYDHMSWGGSSFTRPLYLLVGKSEKVEGTSDPLLESDDDLSSNLVDLDNYWVSINPLTGSISTDPVGAVAAGGTVWYRVQQSRQFAVEKLGIGGR